MYFYWPHFKPTFKNFGIRSATPFGLLSTFMGTCTFRIDELHAMSNVSKVFFDLVSDRYNTRYKVVGNAENYPFELSKRDFQRLKQAMNMSRKYIPVGAFQGSWKGADQTNAKSFYRSVDWIEWFLYVVPTLVVPCFEDEQIQKAVLSLVRGCALSMNWEITEDDLTEIES